MRYDKLVTLEFASSSRTLSPPKTPRVLTIVVIVLQWRKFITRFDCKRRENTVGDVRARHKKIPYSFYIRCASRRAWLPGRTTPQLSTLSRCRSHLSGRRHRRRLAIALGLVLAAASQ